MSFASPAWFALLALIPALVVAQRVARRRAARYAVRFPALDTLAVALGHEPRWRRLVPLALLLAAIAMLSTAMARPHRTVRVPIEQASVVLVTDHSGSMQATDVEPARLTAAQRAAHTFLDEAPGELRIGAVAYADTPDAVQSPTTDRDASRRIIDGLIADGATATGDALQAALALLRTRQGEPRAPAAIILLSDGTTTTGRDPEEVAEEARRRRIPIHTVALGTRNATIPNPNPYAPPLRVPPDPETLRRVSERTGGTAFSAADAERLSGIYERLGSRLGTRAQEREATATFAVGGLLLLAAAAATGLRRRGGVL